MIAPTKNRQIKDKRVRAFSEFLLRSHGFDREAFLKKEKARPVLKVPSSDSLKEYAKERLLQLEKETADQRNILLSQQTEIEKSVSDRAHAIRRADKAESVRESHEVIMDMLEDENKKLREDLHQTQKDKNRLEEAFQNTKDWNRTLQTKLRDRTEALIKLNKEKNHMIYQTNQQAWLREEIEARLHEIEKEKAKLVVSQEHETAAINAVLSQWEKQSDQYEHHVKNLKKSLRSKKAGPIDLSNFRSAKRKQQNKQPTLLNKLTERTKF